MTEVRFSLLSPEFRDAPIDTFELMRQRCPVHHTDEPAPHFSLSRHSDVVAALRDDARWSSKFGPGLAYGEPGSGVLVSSDPPVHTAERLAIARAFKPSVLEGMEPDVRRLVEDLVGEMTPKGRGDLIADLAMPLPLVVMCWMLGLPPEHIDRFRSWVLPMAEGVALAGGRGAHPHVTDAYRAFYAYFGEHIAARSAAVRDGDDVPSDLLTRLLTVERDGQRLSEAQVLGFCQFLLVAGSATTTLLIGNLIHRLLEHPEQWAMLQADRSLVPNAVEESLRFDSPVHGLFRTATGPVTLHDVDIPADAKVLMLFGSANRDPEAWPDADRFDITRDLTDLRQRHTAFGVGIHYCLGAPLSRLEAAVTLNVVLDRLPTMRPDGDPTPVRPAVLHGFDSLPVRWG
jgi:cytochrome P450